MVENGKFCLAGFVFLLLFFFFFERGRNKVYIRYYIRVVYVSIQLFVSGDGNDVVVEKKTKDPVMLLLMWQ